MDGRAFLFCLVFEFILIDQFLHMFRTVYYDNIIIDHDAWNACPVSFTSFLVSLSGISDFQEAFQLANILADINVQIFDVVFGKNLFHNWTARSCFSAVQNDFSHRGFSFQRFQIKLSISLNFIITMIYQTVKNPAKRQMQRNLKKKDCTIMGFIL